MMSWKDDQQKIIAIVRAMLPGIVLHPFDYNKAEIRMFPCNTVSIKILCDYNKRGVKVGSMIEDAHLYRLIFTARTMTAAYGDEVLCGACGRAGGSCCGLQAERSDLPAHIYHAQQAAKAAHEHGYDAVIKYLYNNLKDKTTQEE